MENDHQSDDGSACVLDSVCLLSVLLEPHRRGCLFLLLRASRPRVTWRQQATAREPRAIDFERGLYFGAGELKAPGAAAAGASSRSGVCVARRMRFCCVAGISGGSTLSADTSDML